MSEGTLIPPLRFYAHDENGAPLVGALLYSYYAGSSTALTTYSDAALSTANTNPVECDSYGQAVVFLSPVAHKFVLKTSAGTTVLTQDNVLPWGAGLGSSRTTVCGRITGVTASAVEDVTAGTTIFYVPYQGNQLGLYDGTSWTTITFSETSLALGTDTASKNYDLFAYSSSGTLTLERLVWTSDSARSTALTTQDGVLVKSGDATRRYLGTYRTTAAAGHVDDNPTARLIWNYYHRIPRSFRVTDATDSWTYTTATMRQANGSTANQVAVVIGVAEAWIELRVVAMATNALANTGVVAAIGEDSTAAAVSGCLMQNAVAQNGIYGTPVAVLVRQPTVGYHYYTWLEYSSATGITTWYGDLGIPTLLQTGMTGLITG